MMNNDGNFLLQLRDSHIQCVDKTKIKKCSVLKFHIRQNL